MGDALDALFMFRVMRAATIGLNCPLSLLVNVELQEKSEPDFTAHVGDVWTNTTERRVFLFALAPTSRTPAFSFFF